MNSPLTNEQLREYFEYWWDHINEAMSHDAVGFAPYDQREVWDMIETGEIYFWPTPQSAILAEPVYFPRHKTLNLWCSMGEGKHIWEVAYPAIEKWAREEGFTAVTGSGSPGWVRALRNTVPGVRVAYSVFVKDL